LNLGKGRVTSFDGIPDFFLNEFSFTVKPPSTLLPRQANVTQAQFEAIAVASITELWTNFGGQR
jgi:hypothetical protein